MRRFPYCLPKTLCAHSGAKRDISRPVLVGNQVLTNDTENTIVSMCARKRTDVLIAPETIFRIVLCLHFTKSFVIRSVSLRNSIYVVLVQCIDVDKVSRPSLHGRMSRQCSLRRRRRSSMRLSPPGHTAHSVSEMPSRRPCWRKDVFTAKWIGFAKHEPAFKEWS